jgi:lipoprotein-releasing system permease protein
MTYDSSLANRQPGAAVTVATASAHADTAAPEPVGTRPFAAFEWMLAWRYLRSRRADGFISVIAGFSFTGILLGVMTLIVVMAVMNGFRKELLAKILGASGHVLVQPLDQPFTDYVDIVRRISAVSGVRAVVPFVEGQAFATGSVAGQGAGVLVRGMRQADLARVPSVANNVRNGTLVDFDSREGVAIGRRLAANLGVQVGDRITLLGPDGPQTPFGSTPRRKSYPVHAVFEIGMSELDQVLVFMPMAEAQLFFNQEDRATAIEVTLTDTDRTAELREAIGNALERPVFVTDWRQRNAALATALQVERNVMFLILTLIILVATLNIVSGLIMLVRDKSHDIAILRTMGATRGAVMRIFLITGASIGIVGTLCGFLAGVLIASNIAAIQQALSWATGTNLWDPTIRFLTQIPAEMDPRETASVVAMGLGLSVLATLYPSWRAARLDPVDALRYE